ncbi:MAG: ribosome silencing factor [Lachnospiraceae bacterium]|nr:ribosome silencing factor [Lachnospiraceae bacterium]
MNEQSREMAKIAIKCLEDKKAENIRVIDISTISVLGDYFLIANGNNRNQIQAMSDHVEETLGKAGFEPKQIEGYNTANWILMDYRDVIIHIFDPDNRSYYDLDRIWRDGTPVDLNEL